MPTLSAHHLIKRFRTRTVVKDVSLTVKQGEIVGLLGPNGAGKTTSFYMMVGLVPCDSGSIVLDDKNITALPMHTRARLGIGYLPQEASIFRKLTVWQNVAAILELRHDLTPTQRKDKCQTLLEEFSLTHLIDEKGMSLSGGERRRVEIARALANEPQFILLDEPFAGIDPISVNDIKAIIQHLTERNIGILITDHNVRETLDICERAYIMNEGQVLMSGSPKDILAHPKVREVYLGETFAL